jgi:hypothetical protein
VQRQRLGHLAQLAPAENGGQIFIGSDGSVRVVAVARLLRKTLRCTRSMKRGMKALAAAMLEMPSSRSSFTKPVL